MPRVLAVKLVRWDDHHLRRWLLVGEGLVTEEDWVVLSEHVTPEDAYDRMRAIQRAGWNVTPEGLRL